jgi:flavin reductase (DIM6/NTAB) family NADH-FMN oxidoreductase RutF
MQHFYEPRLGHGLPHDPFNAIVGPRPIGWVSSQSASGVLNLAPYSFFSAFNYVPPLIGFSSIGRKDSLNNIEATGEFVWNLVTQPLVVAMNQTCEAVPPDVNEFELAGLTTAPSRIVGVPRVAQSPVSFECRCTQILQMQNQQGDKLETWMVFGEVVGIHIDQRLLPGGVYDTAHAGHVLRGGGPADYFTIGPEQLFKLYRPTSGARDLPK